MPRYFFNVQDGQNLPDKLGISLPDETAARREAIRYAGKLLEDDAHRIGLGEDWAMEVIDERQAVLFRLDFRVSLSAVVAKPRRPLKR